MSVISLSRKQTYGNLLNRVAELHNAFPIDHVVKVGDGGTEYMWSDRRPYSVCTVDLNWGNKGFEIIGVQQDNAKRTDNNGMSESQSYEFTPNHDAPVSFLKSTIVETEQGKRKIYEPVHWNAKTNRWNKGGTAVTLGRREKYHDFSF
jgi:hypothetical protein